MPHFIVITSTHLTPATETSPVIKVAVTGWFGNQREVGHGQDEDISHAIMLAEMDLEQLFMRVATVHPRMRVGSQEDWLAFYNSAPPASAVERALGNDG